MIATDFCESLMTQPDLSKAAPQLQWNQRYGEPGFAYGQAPNAYLAQTAPRYLPAGAQLFVPADGEGRNGVWLAQQGHRVSSLDASEVGVAKALALAAQRGVLIEARVGDLLAAELPERQYDAVVSIYAHLPPAQRGLLHGRFARALKPGGVLILEGFAREQLGRASGGPKDIDWLYSEAQLRAEFGAWLDFIELQTAVVELDEGPYHQGEAVVMRAVARRRAA
ncbi:Methyltransferase domain-containing protein [Solimonas aquatica]|uniref:Methyltransferase domain-containing protein n=2 Tax=Solimonas aquatica TaxID=489703 RepID=A0A1H9KG76_9GAMM|nr:Methyltransferase domain-containing protein [Solimonas aquatica]